MFFLMKLATWIDSKVENWLLCQPEVSVPLTYYWRKCGSCDNLNTARYFLMKLNKWINGKVEIMHILSFCKSDQNFGCDVNLKFPLAYNGNKWILQ